MCAVFLKTNVFFFFFFFFFVVVVVVVVVVVFFFFLFLFFFFFLVSLVFKSPTCVFTRTRVAKNINQSVKSSHDLLRASQSN